MRKKVFNKLCFILTPIFILFSNMFFNFNETPNLILVKGSQSINIKQVLQNNCINKKNLKSYPTFLTSSNTINSLQSETIIKTSGKSISEMELYPGGNALGIKLNTKGVLVVAYSQIEKEAENIPSISEKSGIELGDNILKINNVEINTAEEMVKLINNCDGKEISLMINRKNKTIEKNIMPVKSKNGTYKIGLWIRDSTSGVGTLTFYDDTTKKFAALGHPVTDEDTGNIMTIKNGEIIKASIVSVKKGEKGNPGELKGNFIEETLPLGNIINNTECGIFGNVSDNMKDLKFNKPLKIGLKEELKEGPAEIITTIDDSGPKRYKIQIEKLLYQDKPGPKSMVIKVTDKKLLEKTGGIVQGMSTLSNLKNVAFGDLKLDSAFRYSSNVVFGTLALDLGNSKLKDTAEKFYFNKSIPSDGFIMNKGRFPELKKDEKGNIAQTGIGQSSILASPMQMALVASTVGNNGVMMKPHLVKGIVNPEGAKIKDIEGESLGNIIRKEDSQIIRDYMRSVITGGTGGPGAFDGTNAAGKTGTADYKDKNGNDAPPHSWFIGFAPYEEPEVAIAVIVEGGGAGGGKAAKAAGKVLKTALSK